MSTYQYQKINIVKSKENPLVATIPKKETKKLSNIDSNCEFQMDDANFKNLQTQLKTTLGEQLKKRNMEIQKELRRLRLNMNTIIVDINKKYDDMKTNRQEIAKTTYDKLSTTTVLEKTKKNDIKNRDEHSDLFRTIYDSIEKDVLELTKLNKQLVRTIKEANELPKNIRTRYYIEDITINDVSGILVTGWWNKQHLTGKIISVNAKDKIYKIQDQNGNTSTTKNICLLGNSAFEKIKENVAK
jgi:hypothetical protein